MVREKFVKAADWCTLEWFWNTTATATFEDPAAASIKVRYGFGWFGKDRQKQTLDGQQPKFLRVGRWSLTRARMQIKVERDTWVVYDVVPGTVTAQVPIHTMGRVLDR